MARRCSKGRDHHLDGSVVMPDCPQNAPPILVEIAKSVPVPVEVGGGIRSMETVNYYLENGVSSRFLGTSAIADEAFVRTAARTHRGKIILGSTRLRGGGPAVDYRRPAKANAVELAERYVHDGIRVHIVYTDVISHATAWRPASMRNKPGFWRKPSTFRSSRRRGRRLPISTPCSPSKTARFTSDCRPRALHGRAIALKTRLRNASGFIKSEGGKQMAEAAYFVKSSRETFFQKVYEDDAVRC